MRDERGRERLYEYGNTRTGDEAIRRVREYASTRDDERGNTFFPTRQVLFFSSLSPRPTQGRPVTQTLPALLDPRSRILHITTHGMHRENKNVPCELLTPRRIPSRTLRPDGNAGVSTGRNMPRLYTHVADSTSEQHESPDREFTAHRRPPTHPKSVVEFVPRDFNPLSRAIQPPHSLETWGQ